MKIYCSHYNKAYTKTSNYYRCPICLSSWYGTQPTPMVIIGCTNVTEVEPKYYDQLDKQYELQGKLIRCVICKDIERRTHYLCQLKKLFIRFKK